MMMSDSLPFTPYDSMEYETVGPSPAPRDKAADMQKRDLKKIVEQPQNLPPGMNQQQQQQQQRLPMHPRPSLEPKLAETDISLGEKKDNKPDIGNYKNVYDLLYILIAVLIVDVAVIFLVRYSPEIFGQILNRWYDTFGLNAVIADVLIIFIGFIIARYIYTSYVKVKFADGKWCPYKFVGTLVGVQLVHDLLFYYGVVNQLPRGHNSMIDMFKDYSAGGPKILAGDAAMMIASAGIAMLLKSQPSHVVASISALVAYIVPYILYTKAQ